MTNKVNKVKLFSLMIFVLLLSSCSSITKEQAETNAVKFINTNVKFYVKDQNSTVALPQYQVEGVTSYKEGSNWVVIAHVSAKASNETKKNDLVVKLSSKGEVLEFNGKPVIK